jgi:uncharacterized protein YkwD
MYRVALSTTVLATALLAISLGGCSLSSAGISSGFADSSSTPSAASGDSTFGSAAKYDGASGPSAKAPGTQVAALNDKAPTGTFEKAPKGALDDRDYTATALDPEKARDLINQYRHEKGLKPLRINSELTEAAKAHSRDLAKWDRISHYRSDGSNPWDRVKRVGYKARLAAENVGTGQVTFDEVLRGWKESPGHNKNLLLGDAQEMGLALVQDPKTEFKSFWTLVVGASM